MRTLGWLPMAACALGLLAHACNYPEFEFRSKASPTTTSTATGGTGGSGATGMGGGGAPTGTTSSTTTTANGGTGGEAAACSPIGLQGNCGAGNKCTVVVPATGEAGCVPAGTTPDYSICAANSECGPSAWCDEGTGVCKPVCGSTPDCANAGFGFCLQARQGGQPVEGLSVCTAHCSPTALAPCGPNVNCVHPGSPDDFDCYISGGKSGLDPCDQSRECAPGQVCAPDGYCSAWCTEAEINQCCGYCFLGGCVPCKPLVPPLTYNSAAMPACWDLMSC